MNYFIDIVITCFNIKIVSLFISIPFSIPSLSKNGLSDPQVYKQFWWCQAYIWLHLTSEINASWQFQHHFWAAFFTKVKLEAFLGLSLKAHFLGARKPALIKWTTAVRYKVKFGFKTPRDQQIPCIIAAIQYNYDSLCMNLVFETKMCSHLGSF